MSEVCTAVQNAHTRYRGRIDRCTQRLIEVYGWTGSLSVITAYGLTTLESDKKLLIDCLNLYGSLAIGYICYKGKVWQAMTLEIAWFAVGVYSLITNLNGQSDEIKHL
jgi:hypothetical protein